MPDQFPEQRFQLAPHAHVHPQHVAGWLPDSDRSGSLPHDAEVR
ncbi:hypothetical protein OG590_34210 [Streptomyces goshikiensis]|nr:hypothetical protein OG590_34210 [Streptomyces goshikiensis]